MLEAYYKNTGPAERIDVFLAEETDLTRSRIQRLIRDGQVRVGGETVKTGYMLRPGESALLVLPSPTPAKALAEPIPLEIVYEDADICVINKPQGLVVHPAPGHESGTLVNALLYHLSDLSGIGGELRPGVVHRIDRMTSGLLAVAKNDAAHQNLAAQFAAHTAGRTYAAIVCGNLRDDTGTIDAPIARHPLDRKRMGVCEGGRSAVTHWRVVERLGQYTLLRVALETGRTHQIRVHMAHIGHPLAGDTVYGAKKPQLGLAGQALHGYRLFVQHPRTNEGLTFYAPLPRYFTDALQKLGLDCPGDYMERNERDDA